MIRLLGMVALCLVGLETATSLARGEDEVIYLDHSTKKETHIRGAIQSEDIAKVVIKPTTGPGTKEISAGDILEVKYEVPIGIRPEWILAINSENAAGSAPTEAAIRDALKQFQALLPQITNAKVKRNAEFKIGQLMALEAGIDPTTTQAAMDQLMAFKKNFADSWQIVPADNLLAQLQVTAGDLGGAQQTLEDLAKTPGISPVMAQDAQVKIIQFMVRAKKFSEAEARINAQLASLPPTDPLAQRLTVARAACVAGKGKDQLPQAIKDLENTIANTKDNDLKALAYNTLGDCYQIAEKMDDARWAYLWVDVMYNQNRDEHARALYNLYKVFKALNDDPKAKQVREELEKGKEFSGSEYQKLVAAEK